MFNNDLFFPAVVSQQNLARVSFYYWTDQKLFYLYSSHAYSITKKTARRSLKKSIFKVFCFHFFRFFHNKAEKIDNVILEIIMPYVQASEALS